MKVIGSPEVITKGKIEPIMRKQTKRKYKNSYAQQSISQHSLIRLGVDFFLAILGRETFFVPTV